MDALDGCVLLLFNASLVAGAHLFSLIIAKRREKQILVLNVDQVLSQSDKLLGKRMKVLGNANGRTNFEEAVSVLIRPFKSISQYFSKGSGKPASYSKNYFKKFELSGNLENLKVCMSSDTIVSGNMQPLSTRKGFNIGISSLYNIFTSKDIKFDGQFTLSSTREVIQDKSKCIVRGILIQGKKGLKIISDHISSHSDLMNAELAQKIHVSFQRFAFITTSLAILWIFKKCIKGELQVLGSTKVQEIEPKHENLCIICYERPVDMIIEPCNHFVICHKCARLNFCIICRSAIENFKEVKFIQN